MKTYLVLVDHSSYHKGYENHGRYVVAVAELGGMSGPLAFAETEEQIPARARNLLILNWRTLDDEMAWGAFLEVTTIYRQRNGARR